MIIRKGMKFGKKNYEPHYDQDYEIDKQVCTNTSCSSHLPTVKNKIHKRGYYAPKYLGGGKVQKYQCQICKTWFSGRSYLSTFKQHKPQLNKLIFHSYSSAMTQRRMARNLQCNLKTVAKKVKFIGDEAKKMHSYILNNKELRAREVLIGELKTFEHTKLKPLKITLAVNERGYILDYQITRVRAKGRLGSIANKIPKLALYSKNTCKNTKQALSEVLRKIKPCMVYDTKFKTEENLAHKNMIKTAYPFREHKSFIVSEENKKTIALDKDKFNDNLFWLNHTCARMRADISRLRHKTWITTKSVAGLDSHMGLFVAYKNNYELAI